MQEQECELRDNIPTATPIFHNKEEESHVPLDFVLLAPSQTDPTMASGRR
jgi:hypothetical protein